MAGIQVALTRTARMFVKRSNISVPVSRSSLPAASLGPRGLLTVWCLKLHACPAQPPAAGDGLMTRCCAHGLAELC